jgi:hypothetical protein
MTAAACPVHPTAAAVFFIFMPKSVFALFFSGKI